MSFDHDDFDLQGSGGEDNETLQSQVLFVPAIDKNADLSGPPMDGFQYLQRVVEERKACDAVVVKRVESTAQRNVGKQIPDFPDYKCSPKFCMDKETQLNVISEFSKLRMIHEARREKIPKDVLKQLNKKLPGRSKETEWLKLLSNKPPKLAESLDIPNTSLESCLAISQPKICSLMEYMEDWIAEGEVSIPLACNWIYTLLACVELPLDPDLCATLRGITRALISRRAQLESLEEEELPHINIVICLIGRYFNQLDLADPLD